jgi:hypothetical protein
MVNMYTIKKNFFTAIVIFSFFTLCGFLSAPIKEHAHFLNSSIENTVSNNLDFTINAIQPKLNLKNGSLQIIISEGNAPFKILIYSTTIPVKEYQVSKELSITNLAAGEYMIVVSGGNNEYRSKTITLRAE